MLAVLDGINTACGTHGWDVSVNSAVGEYRNMFVTPLTDLGTTVLSLGHPVKAVKRQSESYSYGAAGWLNDVDGVGYRMEASSKPIGRSRKGASALYSVRRAGKAFFKVSGGQGRCTLRGSSPKPDCVRGRRRC